MIVSPDFFLTTYAFCKHLTELKVPGGLPFNLQEHSIVSVPHSALPCWQVASTRMVLGIVTDIGLIGQAAARYRRNMHIFLTLCQGHRNSSQHCIDGGRDTDTKLINTHLQGAPGNSGDCRQHKPFKRLGQDKKK